MELFSLPKLDKGDKITVLTELKLFFLNGKSLKWFILVNLYWGLRHFPTIKIADIVQISRKAMSPFVMKTENNKKANFHDIHTVTVGNRTDELLPTHCLHDIVEINWKNVMMKLHEIRLYKQKQLTNVFYTVSDTLSATWLPSADSKLRAGGAASP